MLAGQIPKPLQAEAWVVKGKICVTRGRGHERVRGFPRGKDATVQMIKDDEVACGHFRKALDVGGASVTFEISCRLQLGEIQLRLGRIGEARRFVADAKRQIQSVQHTFLHERLRKVEEQIDESQISEFRYSLAQFSLDEARAEMERKFLLAIELKTSLAPHEFLKNFSRIKSSLNGLTRERLKKLVQDYFPKQ